MRLKFRSVEELETAITKYFDECAEKEKPLTVSGLAVALGTNRQTLLNYEGKPKYVDTIKKAKAVIEAFNEELLYSKDVPTIGVIFNLKNNYNWKDKQEIEADISNEIDITIE